MSGIISISPIHYAILGFMWHDGGPVTKIDVLKGLRAHRVGFAAQDTLTALDELIEGGFIEVIRDSPPLLALRSFRGES